MSERTAQAKQWVEAPARDVWAVFTALDGWTYWAGVGPVDLVRPGRSAPNGVGAARVLTLPGLTWREEVTAFDPPRRVELAVSGGPVRDGRGEVVFDERPHGTVVRWRVRFTPRVRGTGRAVEAALSWAMRHVLGRLENRMAPLARHRSECPYADAPDGRRIGWRLTGRTAERRALTRGP